MSADARGALLLVGGRSTRMGAPKAELDWLGAPLVVHVARIVRAGVAGGPLVVVRAPGQALPTLPADVLVVDDAPGTAGPLAGLAAGLEALDGRAAVAFAAAVDAPLLIPRLVEVVLDALDAEPDAVAAVPHVHGFRQPLAAAYRVALAAQVCALVRDGAAGLGAIGALGPVRTLDEAALLADPALAAADPALRSFANANTPAELAALRAQVHPPG